MLHIPYFQTSRYRVKAMVELADVAPGECTADLGSGDGRIVIAFAAAGARAHGYEIDTELIKTSKANILKHMVHEAAIFERDFWTEDLSGYDIVTMYPMPDIMGELEKKLRRELRPGARILLNYYSFPGWTPQKVRDRISLYIR